MRDFAQAAEGLGYHHLGAPDHVFGVKVARRPDWGNRNTSKDFFHDPIVMFGFLSACTRRIECSTHGVTHITLNSTYGRGPHKRIAGRTISDHLAAMKQ